MNKICTSIEQSIKLIELGIDINTADMYWFVPADDEGEFDEKVNVIYNKADYCLFEKVMDFNDTPYIPAWSLSALLELIPNYVINKADDKTYANLYYGLKSSHDNLVDAAFEMICQMKENGKL